MAESGISTWWIGADSPILEDIKSLPSEVALSIPTPVLGVKLDELVDTWGDARSGGRKHEGIDIMAPRGSFIVSPTVAVVTRIDYRPIGGIVVYTANPGGESYYYAHLEAVKKDLKVGDILAVGDLIGYVGDTGNARGRGTHLHFTIFKNSKALNPYDRIGREFSEEEVNLFKEKINSNGDTIVPEVDLKINRDLKEGMSGEDVGELQEFLIDENTGPQAQALEKMGVTNYFGKQTKKALIEYQLKNGITPAQGYLGSKTKAHMAKVALVN
jgi:hypothetical protein